MGFLSIYDWLQPTNPYAALFFGIIFTIIMAIVIWVDTRKIGTTLLVSITGIFVTVIGVLILNLVGFYG